MSCAHPVARSCARPAARAVNARWGVGFPAALALAWPVKPSLVGARKSAVGPDPIWSYTGPQYDADGVSVGAVPAWHAGKGVWCGPAYTQMLTNSKFIGAVSGTPGTAPTGWVDSSTAGSLDYSGGDLSFTVVSNRRYISQNITLAANTPYYLSTLIWVEQQTTLALLFAGANRFPTGTTLAFFVGGVSVAGSFVLTSGWHEVVAVYTTSATAGTGNVRLGAGAEGIVSGTFVISRPRFATLRNSPYVASDTTGPVAVPSAAGTSGGNGPAWEKTTKLGAIYDGQGTVACKVTLGAASSAVATDTNILTVDDTAVGLIYAASGNLLKSSDGANTAQVSCTWAANDELLIAVELLASTFRIGFAKAADSAITWGTPATYDGSHNSGTHLRLALLNSIPMWADGVYVSSDTGLTAADIRRYI